MLTSDAQRLKAYFEKLAWHEETIRPRALRDPGTADVLDQFLIELTDCVDRYVMKLTTGAVSVPLTTEETRL
jgi:hypothetical protein